MSKKKNPLAEGLEAGKSAKRKKRSDDVAASAVAGGREDRALIAGHFDREVQRQLRIIAAEESVTIQALLAEGLNTLFAKRGKPEIAAASNAAPTPVAAETPAEETEVIA